MTRGGDDGGPATAVLDRPASLEGRARAAIAGSGLLGRFGYLLLTQITLVLFGIGYWMLTTRLVPTSEVGLAAAAVSVATLLSALGVLGIGSLLLAEVGHLDGARVRLVFTTGVLVASSAVTILGLVCWAASPVLGPSLRLLSRHPAEMLLFVIGATTLTAGNVFDCASIGLRRGPAQLARNGLQAGMRFLFVAAIALLGVRSTLGLLGAWVGSLVLSLLVWPLVLRLERPPRGSGSLRARLALVRDFGGLALQHHVLNLAISSVTFFLPVIAALLVLPRDLAYFAVAQLIASAVLLPPALLAMSLFAEAAADDAVLRRHIRRTLPVGFGCCALVLALMEPGAPLILRLFSPSYAQHGATLLRILLLAGIPYVVKDHYVAIRRAQRRLTSAARVVALATCFEAGGAVVGGALFGIKGLCSGWLIATALEGLAFAPAVIRVVRSR